MHAVHRAPGDYPSGKRGDVLTVEFTVAGVPCIGLNGGPAFKHSEAFSFQIATDDQAETDRLWNAIVGNGGQESACGWCKDKWGLSWQITPRALIDAIADPESRGGRARLRSDDADGKDGRRLDRMGPARLTGQDRTLPRPSRMQPFLRVLALAAVTWLATPSLAQVIAVNQVEKSWLVRSAPTLTALRPAGGPDHGPCF